jgi:uncharacterized membrane protein YqhA
MITLESIEQSISEKGMIDELAVEQLKDVVFADKGITKEKANFLFKLKDKYLNKKNDNKWKDFFVDTITAFLLEDDDSPSKIDKSEAEWLRAKIQYNGELDEIEKKLLDNLKEKSINFPGILHFKGKKTLQFEKILFGSRYFTFLAIVGSMLASVILFMATTANLVDKAIGDLSNKSIPKDKLVSKLVSIFVASIDDYLLAIVLLIFSIGVYELFIDKIDIVRKQKDSRPSWLKINSIDDLKSSLGKVILMILIVHFYQYSISDNISYETVNDLLLLGVGILLIAAALFLAHLHVGKKENDQSKENESKLSE